MPHLAATFFVVASASFRNDKSSIIWMAASPVFCVMACVILSPLKFRFGFKYNFIRIFPPLRTVDWIVSRRRHRITIISIHHPLPCPDPPPILLASAETLALSPSESVRITITDGPKTSRVFYTLQVAFTRKIISDSFTLSLYYGFATSPSAPNRLTPRLSNGLPHHRDGGNSSISSVIAVASCGFACAAAPQRKISRGIGSSFFFCFFFLFALLRPFKWKVLSIYMRCWREQTSFCI